MKGCIREVGGLRDYIGRVAFVALALFASAAGHANTCERMLTADVVALDMPLMWNRLGAQNINGMMYALTRDVVVLDGDGDGVDDWTPLTKFDDIGGFAGKVALRPDKRPRPLVLRTGAGDCLTINLTNLLATPASRPANPFELPTKEATSGCIAEELDQNGDGIANDPASPIERSDVAFRCHNDNQVAPRRVSLRFQGTEPVDDYLDQAVDVGANGGDATIAPGDSMQYVVRTPEDGAYIGKSYGGKLGGEGIGGQDASGLWAVLNVNPKGSAFYRSTLTNEELELATEGYTEDGQPIVNYEATFPDDCATNGVYCLEGKAGLPIINIVQDNNIVHTEIDAIVAYGPNFVLAYPETGGYSGNQYLGHFPSTIYPLESVGLRNPTVPNRLEPFREFTVAFHDEVQTTQVFPKWYNDPVLHHTLHGVRDSFMINYGSGGIGSEIIANRLGVGPMHDCVNCAYEEFFLTFHAVGEVGQVVDIPANVGLEQCDPTLANCGAAGPKANYVLYPGDPSNVHHGYVGDNTAFRNLHAGPGEQHVFHLHNHQWLFNANDDNSNYLDAQGLGPGSGYAYWVNFGGAGNRNKTAGDAIFHCHFYPHFAQGMWEMWRIHDALETGTKLQVTLDGGGTHVPFTEDGLGLGKGLPALDDAYNRALPDGEIVAGAPQPAVVPLPGKAMPPMAAAGVGVVANHNKIEVCAAGDGITQVLRNPDGTCPVLVTVETAANAVGDDPLLIGNGSCDAGETCETVEDTFMRPVGSLTKVDRSTVFLDDGSTRTPGYPFWIAGMEHTVGSRPPTPPLDMITKSKADALKGSGDPLWQHVGWNDPNAIDGWDGGLPRFTAEGYSAGGEALVAISRLDMSKEIHAIKPVFFPEEGTDLEQVAMAYHASRCHDTNRAWVDPATGDPVVINADCDVDPNGNIAAGVKVGLTPTTGAGVAKTHSGFLTNGSLPIGGGPFQDPCIDDRGVSVGDDIGWFFSGKSSAPIWDTSEMMTHGVSPFTAENPRVYKGANVQFDAVLNKLGYHFPQQRIIALWQDVVPTITQERPPEPFVLRMNTFDCTAYVHGNVVPKAYELDDYQVRTPTDIIGQHIHLPKWDLTSADGSANGWNYEDGTLSPEAVVEIIEAINTYNEHAILAGHEPVTTMYDGSEVVDSEGHSLTATGILEASNHPFFGQTQFRERWVGARSTLQRWFADPVVNVQGVDRGLGIIFTHDHYGPSTHQQVGLYATVLIEPAGSKWLHNETGVQLYTRTGGSPEMNDGGPTSWQAAILTGADGIGGYTQNVGAEKIKSYREFYFEYTDFQHAYQPEVFVGMTYDENFNWIPVEGEYHPVDNNGDGIIDNPRTGALYTDTFRDAIQPPVRKQASLVGGIDTGMVDDHGDPIIDGGFPVDIWEFPTTCPGGVSRPCPEGITADDPGMYVVNYRNESVLARIYDPNKPGPDALPGKDCSPANPDRTGCGAQADGKAGDLAFALDSNTSRAIDALNSVMGLAPATYFDSADCDNGAGGKVFCPPITNPSALSGGDPFTPTVRVMDGDNVKAKMQAGGQEEEHGATIHGLKWLQGGSGFGESKNSGWRNAQSGGISEQFTLRMPIFADYNQRSNIADYLYTFNPSTDGWSSGTWGIIRSYKGGSTSGLYQLPDNAVASGLKIRNARDFDKACPKDAPARLYDLAAVSVNHVLGQPAGDLGAGGVLIQDLYPNATAGASPNPNGGTLVYNPRATTILPTGDLTGGGVGPLHDPTGIIYVHTKDLISAVEAAHLADSSKPASSPQNDPYCWRAPLKGDKWKYDPSLPACQRALAPNAPIEPVVVRAAAGECLTVRLNNQVLAQAYDDRDNDGYYDHMNGDYLLFQADGKPAYEDKRGKGPQYELSADTNYDGVGDSAPAGTVRFDQTLDLANGNALAAIVRRDPGEGARGMTSFNNNLIQASAWVGLHPQLVEFDVTRSNGVNVGNNPATQAVPPGGQLDYQWYAGHISLQIGTSRSGSPEGTLVATPVEFGGFNISPTDPIKQGQKGLVAAGAVYPAGSTWTEDAGRHTAASVTRTDGYGPNFRDFTTIASKGVSMYYADSYPVENLLGEGSFGVAEDAQDMGHMNINYGNEAMWFRYGKNPTLVAGNDVCVGEEGGPAPGTCLGGVTDGDKAYLAYSNRLLGFNPAPGADPSATDPQTAVFTVPAGTEYRMHVLMPHGAGRGSTYDLSGAVFQRDPYRCNGENDLGLSGKCDMGDGLPTSGSVGSRSIGWNPVGFYLGGIESWFPGEHYEIFVPKAGGKTAVPGDYLFRDHMGLGNTGGLWGVVRVE